MPVAHLETAIDRRETDEHDRDQAHENEEPPTEILQRDEHERSRDSRRTGGDEQVKRRIRKNRSDSSDLSYQVTDLGDDQLIERELDRFARAR